MTHNEELRGFFHRQLDAWPQASASFDTLSHTLTRTVMVEDFPVRLQCNPARIRSASAKVDEASVRQRACFLCRGHRPEEQSVLAFRASREFEILVNPFPIAPEHFTIAAADHLHQDILDPADMEAFIRKYPDYVAFYNGSGAGASAPDHLHFQACGKEFLSNIIETLSACPGELLKYAPGCSIYACRHLPMHCVHFISRSLSEEILRWLRTLLPQDSSTLAPALGMRNILMWFDPEELLHTLFFPRRAHRPSCYFDEGESGMMVSPGALDMAGVIILPRPQDFERITAMQIRHIYEEVSRDYMSLDAFRHLMIT